MNFEIDTTSLKSGTPVYYPGKFGNIPGWGSIVKVDPATDLTPITYHIDMGEDYPDPIYRKMAIPHYCLKPGVGQLFKTREQWEYERNEANDKLNSFFKSFNRKPLFHG